MADWPGPIKSIQRGTITLSSPDAAVTATVTEVDMQNTTLRLCGLRTDNTSGASAYARIVLTNSTTITATRIGTSNTVIVNYELTEYYPGIIKSIQRGTITLAAAVSSNTASVTEVNMNKAEVFNLGFSTSVHETANHLSCNLTLTNSTTITAQRSGTTPEIIISYELVQKY